ncbi:MAG: nitroreductase family protein [Dehalococcoidia bacterium]|nr:MAG: nitroreductase family protein [Dehalococcoidia bacterium]
MALLDIIRHRRSVRDFIDKPVERDKIMLCLEAARLAPSACNSQPWKFIVVDDLQLKDELCRAAFGGIYSMMSFAKKAPLIVAVVSEKAKFLERIGGLLRDTKFYLIDIGIAAEHFVLQAEELGLSTCWIGWFDEGAVKSILKIPRDRRLDVLIAVGYCDESKRGQLHKRDSLKEVTAFNSYDGTGA